MPRGGPSPRPESLRGLDWFIFFLADVQTGFGPFVAVYLTTEKWTQVEIGFVLSIGGIIGLLGQMPGGAIVDAARSERLVAGLAVAAIGLSALSYAVWPIFVVVAAAATLHAAASCVLGPAIAAISLGLVGPFAIGERLGRNARFASLGNGTAAAVMGTFGYLLSSRSVFIVTFVLAIPALLSLVRIRERDVDATRAHGAVAREVEDVNATSVLRLIRQPALLIFAAAILLLQLANAAMLPLMAGVVTTRSSHWAPVLIAACIVVPQAIVALASGSSRATVPCAWATSISRSRMRASASRVGIASRKVTRNTERLDNRYPQVPMTAAATPFPSDAKRALRPNRSPIASGPTKPRLIAAIAGPSTQLAAACSVAAATTTGKIGHAAYPSALIPIVATARPATSRSERAASTMAPPGIWPINATRPPIESTNPIATWVHFCVVR